MLRTTLDKAYIHRTLRPLYGLGQQVGPQDFLLDDGWDKSVDIYPGMVAMLKNTASGGAANEVALIDATGAPFGLFGLYCAPVYGVDEIALQGINSMAIWKLDPGTEYEVLAPAFDDDETYTFPTDGTALLLGAQTTGADRGKLTPMGVSGCTSKPIARCLARPATDRLVISGLAVNAMSYA